MPAGEADHLVGQGGLGEYVGETHRPVRGGDVLPAGRARSAPLLAALDGGGITSAAKVS